MRNNDHRKMGKGKIEKKESKYDDNNNNNNDNN